MLLFYLSDSVLGHTVKQQCFFHFRADLHSPSGYQVCRRVLRPYYNADLAVIDIRKRGTKPGDAAMQWKFPARESTAMSVSFSYKADRDTYVWVRVENQNNPARKSLDRKVLLSKEGGRVDLGEFPIMTGPKQLCLYFGDTPEGKIWLDEIRMDLN